MPWSAESVDVEPEALLPIEPVDPLAPLDADPLVLPVPDADPLGRLDIEPMLIGPDPVLLVPAPLLTLPPDGALALGELGDVLPPAPLPTELLPIEPLPLVEPGEAAGLPAAFASRLQASKSA